MNILFTMLLSGNILFLLFLIIEHFSNNIFSQQERYQLLKTVIFFSVFPVVFVKFFCFIYLIYSVRV